MLSKYGFKKQYLKNSFQDCSSSNVIYFPINDSRDFPNGVRNRAEELNVYFDRDVMPRSDITIFIYDEDGYIELDESIQITRQDILYEPIKKYFLYQIGKALF